MIFSTGTLLENGKYRIDSLIGRGGMAEVWRAERVKDKKQVAIKILMPKSLSHKTVIDRFQLEYDILAKLDHPNIVKVYDFGHYGFHAFHLPWFAMDYYPLNFRERLKQISPGEGIRLLLPILEALQYAHANKICHRDLKPMNVLVGPDDVTVLSDFGVAKELDSTRNLTQRNIIGTPTYLSPEQCTTGQVTPQSDLYTMGIIFYQLCTLKLPFDDTSDFVVIHKHKQEAPIEVQVHNPDISDELNDVVMKCLAKKPEDRFKDALELRKALLACPELKEAGQKRTLRANDIITTPKGRRYRILGLIEQGGFAEIYRVKRIDNGKIYALKILLPMHNYDSSVVKRFQREIKLLKSLDHPYILKVLDDGEYPYHSLKIPYFIMKFFPGSLSGEMNDDIDVNKAIPIILDVLEALAHAHTSEGGVLHRDLKPSNILIGGDGHGYLADFGIAKATKEGSGLKTRNPTMTRGMLGTYAYASPEQLQEHDLDARSDIYSMGVILYELACGRRPFEAKTEAQILSMHLKERPKLPLIENPKISPKFQAVIMKCLEKLPEKRYKDVPELIEALSKAGQKEPWVGKTARVTRETMIFSAKNAIRSAAGILGVAAAGAMFLATIGGAQIAANRMKVGAMASAMEGRPAGAIRSAPQAPYPSIFYPEESAKKLAAIAKLRQEAAKSRDVALASRLDALAGEIWKGDVSIPELKLGGDAERVVTISKKDSAASFLFAVQGAAPGAAVEYAYEVLPEGGKGEAIKKETSAKPEFKVEGLPASQDEQSYLLKIAAIYKDPAAGGKSYTVALADYPEGIKLKIRKLDKPVNIAAAGPNQWRLANASDDPDKKWDRWRWLFKNLDSGEEVAAPPSSADGALEVGDEFYRAGFPSDGRYAVVCEALDKSQIPQRNAESAAPTIVVDRTPPKLEIAEAGKPIVLLPNESREIALRGEDALARDALEFYADGTKTPGATLRLGWKQPARGEARKLEKLKAEAREPKGHGLELASPPVELDVYSVSEESFDLLTAFAQSSKTLKADSIKYARTLAMAPAGDLERLVSASGTLDRDWLAENIADGRAFQAVRELMKKRADLMKIDDKFGKRMEFFRHLAASGGRPDADKLVAALDAKAAAWPSSADADPNGFLQEIERDIVPPPSPSALEIVRTGAPLDRHVALRAEFLQQVDPKAQYQYLYPVEAAASKSKPLEELSPGELESLLANDKRAVRNAAVKLFLDPSVDFNAYTNKHYLVIQTYLEDKENNVVLKSAARAYPIDPFAPLPEGTAQKVKEYGKAIKAVQAKGPNAYPKALAWADAHPNPLSTKALKQMLADAKRSERPIDDHLGSLEKALLASSDDPAKVNDFLGYVDGLLMQIKEEPAIETPIPAMTSKPAATPAPTTKPAMKETPPPTPAPTMQASPAPMTPEPTPPPPTNIGQITDAEARQMGEMIAAALPRKGSGGNLKKAFQSYGALFGGGDMEKSSDLFAKSKDRLEAVNAGAAAFSGVRLAQRDPSDPDAFIYQIFFNTGRNNIPLNHRIKFARAGGKLVIVKDEFIPKN